MLRQTRNGLMALYHLVLAAALFAGHSVSCAQALEEGQSVSEQAHQKPAVSKKAAPFTLSVRRMTTQTGFPEIARAEDLISARSLVIQGRSFEELAKFCAPELSPATAYRIAREFSGAKPWSVSITGGSVVSAESEESALALISKLKEKGKSVSLGLFQLPEDFIIQAGADLPSALEPCRNLRLASRFLLARYRDSVSRHGMSFLAAREALEDLRAAAGKTTRYTHAEENGVMDYGLPEYEEDSNTFSETAAIRTGLSESRGRLEKQNAVKTPASFVVLQKTGALNSVKARNKDERNNRDRSRSLLAANSHLMKAGDKQAAKGREVPPEKEEAIAGKRSEGIFSQGQKSFRREKNVFLSAAKTLTADSKTVLSTSNQGIFK